MRAKGFVDSLNFSSSDLEKLFCNEDYIIEEVKSIGVFEPTRWVEVFKSNLTRNIVEAKILHTSTGLMLPIKRYSTSQDKQTLEYAGLQGYNDKSTLLSELLLSLKSHIQDEVITRLDIAIDFKGKIPNRVIKKLCEDRDPFRYWNTTYYKSKSEKKSNNRLNIKTYNKSKTKNDSHNIQRLEFSFLSSYLQKVQVKDIEKSYTKMAKTMKRFSGLDVEISSL